MSDEHEITHAFGLELDKGQKRPTNGDSLGAIKRQQASADGRYSIGIYLVADGVAGTSEGDVASRIAIESAMQELLDRDKLSDITQTYREHMIKAAEVAHREILSHEVDLQKHGATTLVMAIVVENRAYILNVGDSRAYIVTGDAARQVTIDHTLVQRLLDEGEIDEEQAATHPWRNVLSEALGTQYQFTADVFIEYLKVGDYLILCSDGLYKLVPDDQMIAITTSASSPQLAAKSLVQAANNAGGKDNIAVVVIEIKERE